MGVRLVLASQSSGRLRTLQQAGIDPEVIVSGFDEDAVVDRNPARLAQKLAEAKGRAVLPRLAGDVVVVACDSVLELEGRPRGKPGSREAAVEQWLRMRGREGVLHTGHWVLVRRGDDEREALRVASTLVRFADLSETEIRAYAATDEPVQVAGAFTIDSLGGAYVTAIEGDPHNVVGLSLPLLRQMLIDLGVEWHTLWRPGTIRD